MAVENGSFEFGANGVPTAWVIAVVATALQVATYALTEPGETAYYFGAELFEHSWSVQPFVTELSATDEARYEESHEEPRTAETFELGWGSNPFLSEIASAEQLTADDFAWFVHDPDLHELVWVSDSFEAWGAYESEVTSSEAAEWHDNGALAAYETFGHLYLRRIFVGDSATDELTSAEHGYADSLALMLEATSGVLPEPLNAVTRYYVRDSATNVFKLSLAALGAAIDLSTSGVGTLTAIPDPAEVWNTPFEEA